MSSARSMVLSSMIETWFLLSRSNTLHMFFMSSRVSGEMLVGLASTRMGLPFSSSWGMSVAAAPIALFEAIVCAAGSLKVVVAPKVALGS